MRSQHLCSILSSLSAGGEAHHHRLIKDLYLLDTLLLIVVLHLVSWVLLINVWGSGVASVLNFLFLEEFLGLKKKITFDRVKYHKDCKSEILDSFRLSFLIMKQSRKCYILWVLLIFSFGLSPANAWVEQSWTSLFSERTPKSLPSADLHLNWGWLRTLCKSPSTFVASAQKI